MASSSLFGSSTNPTGSPSMIHAEESTILSHSSLWWFLAALNMCRVSTDHRGDHGRLGRGGGVLVCCKP